LFFLKALPLPYWLGSSFFSYGEGFFFSPWKSLELSKESMVNAFFFDFCSELPLPQKKIFCIELYQILKNLKFFAFKKFENSKGGFPNFI